MNLTYSFNNGYTSVTLQVMNMVFNNVTNEKNKSCQNEAKTLHFIKSYHSKESHKELLSLSDKSKGYTNTWH